MNKLLDTHEQIVGNSWAIFSMVAAIFYGVIVVLYGDVVSSIFRITMIILVKDLLRYLCDVLYFITTNLN